MKKGDYIIVRSLHAGVFAGVLQSKSLDEIVLTDVRRIWSWKGAATLSELAQSGTKKPADCKFPEAVNEIIIFYPIELLMVTDKARKSIESVPIWQD